MCGLFVQYAMWHPDRGFVRQQMFADTAQGLLDLRFWIAETAHGLRLTASVGVLDGGVRARRRRHYAPVGLVPPGVAS